MNRCFSLCVCRVRAAEGSALRALKEKLFSHRSELMLGFQQYDHNNAGAFFLLICNFFPKIFLYFGLQTFLLHPRHGVSQWMGSGSGDCGETGPSLEDTAATPSPSCTRRQSEVPDLFWRHGTRDPSGSGLGWTLSIWLHCTVVCCLFFHCCSTTSHSKKIHYQWFAIYKTEN